MISNRSYFHKGEKCFKIIINPNTPTQQTFIAPLIKIIEKITKCHSFIPSFITSNSFEQQLFFININNKTSFKRINYEIATTVMSPNATLHDIQFCGQKFNIYPTFAYYSSTDTIDSSNFFLCFVLDQLITNKNQSIFITQVLNNLFGNVDPSCENPEIFPCANNNFDNYIILDHETTISYDDILIANKQIFPNYPVPIVKKPIIRNNHKSDMNSKPNNKTKK